MQYSEHDLDSGHDHNPEVSGYELEAGTQLLAINCIICGRPLRDPESAERGVGPICAEKWKVFSLGGTPRNPEALDEALGTSPEPLRKVVERQLPNDRQALSAAIHAAGNAWESRDADWTHYVGSTMEIAQALGYPGIARALTARFIEGKTIDAEGNVIGRGKPAGILVLDKGDGRWEIRLPYIGNYSIWKSTMRQLEAAGARIGGKSEGYPATIPSDRWVQALNALVDGLAGTLGVLPTGETFIVPPEKLPVPETAEAPGAPDKIDEPKPAKPEQLAVGDRLTLRDGRTVVVSYVGDDFSHPGYQRIGIVSVEDAERSMRDRGYIWNKKYNSGYINTYEQPVTKAKAEEKKAVEEEIQKPLPRVAVQRDLPASMYPFQREGVMWLDERGSGILAFEQGLGKTIVALAATDVPAVVCVPASLRINWGREATMWRPDLVTAVVESADDLTDEVLKANVIVIGYDNLDPDTIDKLIQRGIQTFIVDEAQACKELKLPTKRIGYNQYAIVPKGPKRAVAMYKMAKMAARRLFLTGTPMVNGRPYELFPLLHMVDPKEWESQRSYWTSYCDLKKIHTPQGDVDDTKGRSNLGELRDRVIGKYLLRQTKEAQKEVLGLPEKAREYKQVTMDPEWARQYREAAQEFITWVRRNRGPAAAMRAARAEVIGRLTALRRLAALGKVPAVLDECLRFLRDTGRPLIVMAHHDEAITSITEALETAGYRVGNITGKVTGKKRQKAVDEFQKGVPETKPPEKRKFLDVLVCSITAAGVGLTLTRAQDMFIMERVWRPFDLIQAEDRIHRIGQKNAVTITYYDAPGTIDIKLAKLLIAKMATAAQVIDGYDLDEDEAIDEVMKDMFAEIVEELMANPATPASEIMARADWAEPDV